MADELDAPLGQKKPAPGAKTPSRNGGEKPARRGWRSLVQFKGGKLPLTRIIFGVLFALIAAIAAIIVFVEDPNGGRPTAEVQISTTNTSTPPATNVVISPVAEKDISNSTPSTVITDEGISIITIGDDVPDAQNAGSVDIVALTSFGVMPDLIEETPNGPIPVISPKGDTAFVTYQRASVRPGAASGKPLIAIIVTGLGLSESGTIDAIEKLPGATTLAFAPYGRTLQRTSLAARNGGHELLLALPLEPFDYPDNDPGPQTLLTDQPIRANLDRLFWLMARFGGYVGVINHTGAKFTASSADFAPIMEELSMRGLGYVDDGTSNRSLAANLAGNNRVPFGRATVQLDDNPSRSAILAALGELEKKATENGSAIGIASALPVSVKTISEWTRTLESKNIVLVPISALMTISR